MKIIGCAGVTEGPGYRHSFGLTGLPKSPDTIRVFPDTKKMPLSTGQAFPTESSKGEESCHRGSMMLSGALML